MLDINLGQITEDRLREVFGRGATARAVEVANILAVDEKTLRGMTARGEIGCTFTAKGKRYTERHVREYLEQDACPSTLEKTKQGKRSGGTISSGKPADFSARRRMPQNPKPPRQSAYVSRALRRERKMTETT
jgi:hypothetical protein